MLILKVCVTYPDGQAVWGTMQAASAACKFPVAYSGPVERLGNMPKAARPAELELLFATAIYNGANGGGVCAEGEFDFGPKYVADDRLLEVQRHRERYVKG